LEYGRGEERVWVYGALRVRDGQERTLIAPSRNTAGWQRLLLQAVERANPAGDLYIVSDNLASRDSRALREWLVDHPRLKQVFIPKGACWLNLQEGWWRLFRRAALAGQSFANAGELEHATRWRPGSLNRRAGPWVWGRPPPPARKLRRKFVYRL
jgi:hypothetical protein